LSNSDIYLFHAFNDNTLTVTSRVNGVVGWPWLFGLHVICDLRVDPSMRVSMNVKTSTGKIVMKTEASMVFDSLKLEAVAGGVEASFVGNFIANLKTTTGGININATYTP
jgi:hypothetical protein